MRSLSRAASSTRKMGSNHNDFGTDLYAIVKVRDTRVAIRMQPDETLVPMVQGSLES